MCKDGSKKRIEVLVLCTGGATPGSWSQGNQKTICAYVPFMELFRIGSFVSVFSKSVLFLCLAVDYHHWLCPWGSFVRDSIRNNKACEAAGGTSFYFSKTATTRTYKVRLLEVIREHRK